MPGTLSWYWPASGSPTSAFYAGDDDDAHELHPCTSAGLYFDEPAPVHITVTRAGTCTHERDAMMTLEQFKAAVGDLEAHRADVSGKHVCGGLH